MAVVKAFLTQFVSRSRKVSILNRTDGLIAIRHVNICLPILKSSLEPYHYQSFNHSLRQHSIFYAKYKYGRLPVFVYFPLKAMRTKSAALQMEKDFSENNLFIKLFFFFFAFKPSTAIEM